MGERGQVARRPHRPLARHHGGEATVQHRPEDGHRLRPHPRGTLPQAGQLQRHHQASDRHRHRLADPGGVRQDEVSLERREVAGRDPHPGQLPEAGVDAVHRLAAGHDGGHGVRGAGDEREGGRVERTGTAAIDGLPFVQRHGAGTDQGDAHRPLQTRRCSGLKPIR